MCVDKIMPGCFWKPQKILNMCRWIMYSFNSFTQFHYKLISNFFNLDENWKVFPNSSKVFGNFNRQILIQMKNTINFTCFIHLFRLFLRILVRRYWKRIVHPRSYFKLSLDTPCLNQQIIKIGSISDFFSARVQ